MPRDDFANPAATFERHQRPQSWPETRRFPGSQWRTLFSRVLAVRHVFFSWCRLEPTNHPPTVRSLAVKFCKVAGEIYKICRTCRETFPARRGNRTRKAELRTS